MCKVKAAMQHLTKLHVVAMFTLANIDVLGVEEIDNEYSPSLIDTTPWFKVLTPVGTIKLGNRKRVINIDWTDTSVRCVVTTDHVTKSETNVHAWTVGKAVDYLTLLQQHANNEAAKADDEAEHVND